MHEASGNPQETSCPGGRNRRMVWLLWAFVGLSAGFMNGLLGASGGILLVSALPHLPTPACLTIGMNPFGQVGADRRDLFASALAVMLPVSAVSAFRYWQAGFHPAPSFLLPLLAPAAAGGIVGAYLLERTSPLFLRRLFAVVILVSGIRMLF